MEFFYTNRIGQQDLEVYEVGATQCNPDFRFGPGVRDIYILHYVHSGSGYVRHGEAPVSHKIARGDFFIVLPDTVYTYWPEADDPWGYSWIGFGGSLADRLVREAGFAPEASYRRAWDDTEAGRLFEELMGCRDEPAKELLLTGLLYRLLGKLSLAGEEGASVKVRPTVGEHVRKATHFINVHYARKISLHDISTHIGLDEKYVCRLFQKELAMSPYRFLLEVRMRKAIRLLRRNALSVAEVARSVGYADPLLFSRMFKRVVGASPSEYRARAMKEHV